MFLRYLQGSPVLRDETDGEADGGSGTKDRGDDFEIADDEVVVVEEEEKEEGEESSEEKKAEEKKDDDKKVEDKKPKMVPHARMKEAVEKERKVREATEKRAQEAEDKLKESQRGVDVDKLNTEIDDLEEAIDKATADNKPEEKKALRKQLRDKMQTLARAEAVALSAQATAMAVERVRYDSLVERLEVSHPQMNPDSDDYDEESVAEVVELKEAYEAKGLSSTEALKKAVKYVYKAEAKKEAAKEEETEETDETEEVQERREKAVRRAEQIKAKQPAQADKAGKASDKVGGGIAKNIQKLSDDEFDKLDPKEVARLRGDSV